MEQHAQLTQSGELPPSWGSNATFANLKSLILRGNQLQGGLPASWAEPAAFTSLDHLDVSGTPHAHWCLVSWSLCAQFAHPFLAWSLSSDVICSCMMRCLASLAACPICCL